MEVKNIGGDPYLLQTSLSTYTLTSKLFSPCTPPPTQCVNTQFALRSGSVKINSRINEMEMQASNGESEQAILVCFSIDSFPPVTRTRLLIISTLGTGYHRSW